MLSGYRLMWLMTIFDLPVQTKEQRKEASGFRNHLLDSGFEMVQYSVYMKSCSGKDQAETICSRISDRVPRNGNIKVLQFTDKQFGEIRHFGSAKKREIDTQQLVLF